MFRTVVLVVVAAALAGPAVAQAKRAPTTPEGKAIAAAAKRAIGKRTTIVLRATRVTTVGHERWAVAPTKWPCEDDGNPPGTRCGERRIYKRAHGKWRLDYLPTNVGGFECDLDMPQRVARDLRVQYC